MQNPCMQNCPDRDATCHITCRRYKLFAMWCEHRRAARHQENITTGYSVDQIRRNTTCRNLPKKAKWRSL